MWLVCILHLCNLTAFKANMMVVSLYAIEMGAEAVALGALFSTFSLAPILLSVYAGRLSDTIGVRVPMLIGSAGVSAALALAALVPGLPAQYVSAAILGGAYVFYHVSIQSMVGALSTPQTRARNFANFSLIATVPYFIGPLATGFLIEHGGHALAFGALAVLPVISVAVLLLAGRAMPRAYSGASERKTPRSRDLLRNRPLVRMAVTSGFVLTSVDLFQFYAPLHGHAAGLSPSEIGVVLSMYAVAAVAVRLVMEQLVGLCGGEERLLAVSLALAVIGYAGFPLTDNAWFLGVFAFLLGTGLGCAQPLSMMLTYNYSPPGRSGEGLGLRLTVNNAAHFVLPFAFGLVSAAFGLLVVFWSNAGILAGGAAVARRDAARPAVQPVSTMPRRTLVRRLLPKHEPK